MVYKGNRKATRTTARVTVDGKPLSPCCHLLNHSPSGFEWGYGGSGPAQLALAILAHELGARKALKLYQDFKWDIIAQLSTHEWEITSEEIQKWLEKHKYAKKL